ncbi:hypothetical protein D3C71_1651470 [compost metagenome]
MQVAFKQPPEEVAVAAAEEADRLDVLQVVGVVALQRLHIEFHRPPIDERPDELALMKQAHRLRRRIDKVHIARVQVVGRKELADEDHQVERDQEDAGDQRQLVPTELPPHQSQLRSLVHPHLLFRHRFDGIGIEWCSRYVVRQRFAGRRKE